MRSLLSDRRHQELREETAVIVGAGQGGLQTALSLRQEGFKGAIKMLGAEPGLPYQRPPLSKGYLKDGNLEALVLRPHATFRELEIILLSPVRVDCIDRERRQVILSDNSRHEYDHLILATGARAIELDLPGNGFPGVHRLRTASDAVHLRSAIATARRIVVIGGGFIGLEFAAVARGMGSSVTVVEGGARLMQRAISATLSKLLLDFHRSLRTEIILNRQVVEILRDRQNAVAGVVLSDGLVVEGDLVLQAVGIRPNMELAAASGLDVADGILVDSYLRTADPAISAIGDCAAFPHLRNGRPIRLESIQACTDHARTVAKRIVGQLHPYDAIPWFWSDQADWKLQIAGLADPDDEELEVTSGARVAVIRHAGGQITALETINSAAEHMAARHLFRKLPKLSLADLRVHKHSFRQMWSQITKAQAALQS